MDFSGVIAGLVEMLETRFGSIGRYVGNFVLIMCVIIVTAGAYWMVAQAVSATSVGIPEFSGTVPLDKVPDVLIAGAIFLVFAICFSGVVSGYYTRRERKVREQEARLKITYEKWTRDLTEKQSANDHKEERMVKFAKRWNAELAQHFAHHPHTRLEFADLATTEDEESVDSVDQETS